MADTEEICELRDVRTPCHGCYGLGTKTYGSTATWRGGIGGAAMTSDVCDDCWGSGDEHKHWPSHRDLEKRDNRDISKLVADHEAGMKSIGGCSDGNCVIDRPKGMHTNGGCHCYRDEPRARRAMQRSSYFLNKIKEALK